MFEWTEVLQLSRQGKIKKLGPVCEFSLESKLRKQFMTYLRGKTKSSSLFSLPHDPNLHRKLVRLQAILGADVQNRQNPLYTS